MNSNSAAHDTLLAAGERADDRVPEFDGLRGVLAWFVVLVHVLICCGWFGPQWKGRSVLSEVAQSALNIYILLSGFAITRLLVVKGEPFGRYLWRRACRIIPAYWIALAVAIPLNGWLATNLRRLPPTPDAQGLIMICDLGASRFWTDTILHVLLVHGIAPAPWLPFASYTFLGVAWSLSLEWQFYCLAPFVLSFATKNRTALAAVVIAAGIGLCFSSYWMRFFSDGFLPIKGGFILAGALTYFIFRANDARLRASLWKLLCPAFVASLLWAIGSHRLIESSFTFAVWAAVVTAALSGDLGFVSAFLNSQPLQYLGRVSYSTYLFHVPIITLVQAAIWRYFAPQHQLALFALTMSGAIVGTALVSDLSWRCIERPFQRLGGRPLRTRGGRPSGQQV